MGTYNYSIKAKNKNKKLNPLPEINTINVNSNNKEIKEDKPNNNKILRKSASQPKYHISKKIKLKPINNKSLKKVDNKNNNVIENTQNKSYLKNTFEKIEESKNEDNYS